ncbi:ral guanine nucleotide dissociation stimulator-like 2 isoform X2 [Anolis carolinensis]|uniref:ral guanine nucleotide dissociation stimulator-like 2 isoform X2 n=1 Tax=Anolis carolinensis TaxID=28377 RepID=UPI002F2B5A78
MKVFLRLGGCLEPGGPSSPSSSEGGFLTRTRWYCLPAKAPVTSWEEAEDGAIYTVSSRLAPGTRGEEEAAVPGLSPEGVPAQVSRSLKAGTLPALVRHLLEAPSAGDLGFVPSFLGTFRTFAAPQEVLGLLLHRLEEVTGAAPGPNGLPPETAADARLQRSLASLLCSWLEGFPEDFARLEPALQGRLLSWLRWALGRGSGPEKALLLLPAPEGPNKGPPPTGTPTREDDAGEEPDPHFILGLQAEDVAAHLTATDAALFLGVVPQECLGSLWSRRDKKGHERDCPSVRATVAQFNRVATAVVFSCLADTALRAAQRARLLEKWIRVAEECFLLRNFSSLYAVVSALHSTPIHRLKRTWEETSRDCLRCYEELSAVCSEEDNYSQSRRLLFQEGAPRGSPGMEPTQRRHHHHHHRRSLEQRPTGVVPYLGTFLKDLVMLDAATKNRLKNGYINFEKHRKEFEIMTQLRLLQANCRNYALSPDPSLQRWFQGLPSLSETQSYLLSCAIEPPVEGGTPAKAGKPTVLITHCTDLLTSLSMNTLVPWDRSCSSNPPPDLLLPPASPDQGQTRLNQHTKWPSVSALDSAPESTTPTSLGGLAPPPPQGGTFVKGHRRSASCGSAYPAGQALGGASASECRIIRVSMALQDGTLYKSILVTSQDKAPVVIAKALEKHNQDRGLAPQYQLVQLLPGGRELAFPPTANVFYAMNGACQDFMLRAKGVHEKPLPGTPVLPPPPPPPPPKSPTPRRMEISATFPKIKATGRKIARALF